MSCFVTYVDFILTQHANQLVDRALPSGPFHHYSIAVVAIMPTVCWHVSGCFNQMEEIISVSLTSVFFFSH